MSAIIISAGGPGKAALMKRWKLWIIAGSGFLVGAYGGIASLSNEAASASLSRIMVTILAGVALGACGASAACRWLQAWQLNRKADEETSTG
jgi:hypothetical protein